MLSGSGLIAQVNMWVMSFDNLYNDAEINWLKEGFVDFIIDHYKMNPNVHVYKTEKLDKALSKIRSDARFREIRNLVLSGAYQRKKGEFIVELQLTDLGSWETLANKTVREKSSDLTQLIMVVNAALDEILDSKMTESSPIEQETRPVVEKIDVFLSFKVDYQMRISILQEIMETLKYKNKNEGKDYIEYSFSGNDYVFTSQFVKKVAYGEYRYFPVIFLIDENGQTLMRLIDSPASLDQVKRFNPMFNIAAGPWTITVFLSKGFQSIDYELTLPLQTIAKISQVSINMMTEEEIVRLTQDKKY